MNELTTEIIQNEVLNKLIYRGYSFSTIHKAYVLINQCLKYAYHQHIISNNPCDFVAEPSKKIFARKPIRFFTDEEIAKFIDCATLKDSNNQYKYTKRYCFSHIDVHRTSCRRAYGITMARCKFEIKLLEHTQECCNLL